MPIWDKLVWCASCSLHRKAASQKTSSWLRVTCFCKYHTCNPLQFYIYTITSSSPGKCSHVYFTPPSKKCKCLFFPPHLLSLLLCILQSILSPCCGITAALICKYNPACFTWGASLKNHRIIQGKNRHQSERSGRTEFPHGRVRNLLFWKASAWVLPACALGTGQPPSSSVAISTVNAELESQSGAMQGEAGLVGNSEKH